MRECEHLTVHKNIFIEACLDSAFAKHRAGRQKPQPPSGKCISH